MKPKQTKELPITSKLTHIRLAGLTLFTKYLPAIGDHSITPTAYSEKIKPTYMPVMPFSSKSKGSIGARTEYAPEETKVENRIQYIICL